MNWQELLTSDKAIIVYELIIFLIFVFFIVRLNKQVNKMREEQEKANYLKQREELNSKLTNSRGGN